MQITEKQLEEFKLIYKEEFGKEISDKEALDKALNLVNLMKIVYQPTKNTNG